MAIQTRHPLYAHRIQEWIKLRDTYAGEEAVKARRQIYLPPTQGMVLDGFGRSAPNTLNPDGSVTLTYSSHLQKGDVSYQSYLTRAVFHDFVSEAVELMLGLLHQKDATIELPAAMEPMRELATTRGESLQMLLRRVNEQQLVTGRVGLLADLPSGPSLTPTPYIATYLERTIINWDDGSGDDDLLTSLNMVVLDESSLQRQGDGFDWKTVNKYRVLLLGDLYANELSEGTATYSWGLFTNEDGSDRPMEFSVDAMEAPTLRGRPLEEIPFVFINTKDIVAAPDNPPLLGLANLSLTIYRGEADYRQNLHWQGQDTLVKIGSPDDDDEGTRVGAGAEINVPMGGDAKYIGVSSQGLPEQRQALDADKLAANAKAGQLINMQSKAAESGAALQIRVGAQTASLHQIATTGAFGLQRILRVIARWMGADPEQVVVKPNLDFADVQMDGQTLVQLLTAKAMGAPISLQTIHNLMQQRGVTTVTYEEELDLIAEEMPLAPPVDTTPAGAGGPTNAGGGQ